MFDLSSYSVEDIVNDSIVMGPSGPARISEHWFQDFFGIGINEDADAYLNRKVREMREEKSRNNR